MPSWFVRGKVFAKEWQPWWIGETFVVLEKNTQQWIGRMERVGLVVEIHGRPAQRNVSRTFHCEGNIRGQRRSGGVVDELENGPLSWHDQLDRGTIGPTMHSQTVEGHDAGKRIAHHQRTDTAPGTNSVAADRGPGLFQRGGRRERRKPGRRGRPPSVVECTKKKTKKQQGQFENTRQRRAWEQRGIQPRVQC